MLEVEDLVVSYGSIQAVRGVSLEVGAGRIVALIGSNGAGKSTTLKAVSGLLNPRSGRVLFQGEDVTAMPASMRARTGIILVPEGRRIFSNLSVAENLLMSSFARGSMDGFRRDMDRILDIFPVLRDRLGQRGGTLSGGEQQMLAIARGLLCRPKVLLLDEPSLGLAPLMVESIFKVIASIRESRVAILLVEQNARAALEVADYGYVLENGRVVSEGDCARLKGDDRVRRAYLGIRD